jgi:hypothetical protein
MMTLGSIEHPAEAILTVYLYSQVLVADEATQVFAAAFGVPD